MTTPISRVESAIRELQKGQMIILTDHPSRENEGDLVFPAEMTTPEKANFMIRNCSGIICLSLKEAQLKQLGLSYMVAPHENSSQRGTPFTVSIEARSGVTTGVSAEDRAKTILAAIAPHANSEVIVKPGHIFPLHAQEGGVLERQGHTEGAVDIVRLAGFKPAAALCEVMNPDGTMTKGDALKEFAKEHHLQILSIDDIIAYRRNNENLIAEEVTTQLPIKKYGTFKLSVFKEKYSTQHHMVLARHHFKINPPVVRIHSACITGDLFGSERCDCHMQLEYSLQKISDEGGLLIYLNQEGRGIGLFNKIKAYSLQENGLDTVAANESLGLPVDAREYYFAANILRNLNLFHIRLLTNNPYKISNLKEYGIKTVEREAIPVFCNKYNKNYLVAKKNKLNHLINTEIFKGENYA